MTEIQSPATTHPGKPGFGLVMFSLAALVRRVTALLYYITVTPQELLVARAILVGLPSVV